MIEPLSWISGIEEKYVFEFILVFPLWIRLFVYCLAVLLVLAILEQISILRKKGKLSGPLLSVPFVGGFFHMLFDPPVFWDKQIETASKDGISWNSIFGHFIVFLKDASLSRHMFSLNSHDDFVASLHPNCARIVGENNLVFRTGEDHKTMRKSFMQLFTKNTISKYISIQDKLIRKHIKKWLAIGKPDIEMRYYVRDLNLEASQTVLVGPYIDNPAEFSQLFRDLVQGFLSLPINFPGTALWKAIRARKKVQAILTDATKRAKQNMQDGKQPQCVLDFWCLQVIDELKNMETGQEVPVYATDFEMGATVILTFLFAAQDASTASLVNAIAFMSDYPEILEKIREEQARLNPTGGSIDVDLLETMTYTKQVAKEILRFRPPVPMWPKRAKRDIRLTEDFVCPKDAIVVPSLTGACQGGFTNPEVFDPDRMGPERKEDVKFFKNFLTFGSGPHSCAGREYATNHLVLFLAILSTSCSYTRKYTSKSDKVVFLPTSYPADCLITFKNN